HLAPAVGLERIVASTIGGIGALSGDAPTLASPETTGQFTALDGDQFTAIDEDAKVAVDEALSGLDDEAFTKEILSLRSGSMSGDISIGEIDERWDAVTGRISERIEDEIIELTTVTSTLGGADGLITAAETAQAAVEIQRIQAAQAIQWARVALPLFPSPASDVRNLSNSIAGHASAVRTLDTIAESNAELLTAWESVRNSGALADLNARFESAVERRLADGVSETTRDWDVAPPLTPGMIGETIDFLAELGDVIEVSAELSAASTPLVDTALDEVSSAVDAVAADAQAERSQVLWNIAAVVLLACAAALLLGWLVTKPLKNLATAAERVRDGDLSGDLPERGPTELRVAARALNESVDSLRQVEAQAVAMADGDLDNPVLEQPATGTLGRSMQVAVDRLAESLGESERFQARLAHEAAHDGLTGLPNRTSILDAIAAALARARRSDTAVGLLFLDVDEFKGINDTYGHHVGDVVLREVSKRLKSAIRDGDSAGRLGGDEFIVLAEPVSTIDEAVGLARRLYDQLVEPIDVDGLEVLPKISIGVTVTADGDLTEDDLLRDADLAVYRAKELGRGRIEVYDDDLRRHLLDRAEVESSLRLALANDEMVLHFQPSVDRSGGEVTGIEALVRWERPGHGLVPPGDFIPVAERSDLIVELDNWVLEATAVQLAAWSRHGQVETVPVSVNISGRHLASGSLVANVAAALEAHGVEPERLMVEITETALLDDLDTAAAQLSSLRSMGVRIALDDFGTGYMSLATLRALPVDVLKIDMSFVAQLDRADQRSLVKLIIGSGHVLGLTVTAEGVETATQRQRLSELGADNLQGFLFSRPLTRSDLEDYLSGAESSTSV
ncbi:MAG: putative bifunctional diguanylate cyclase/phosphodiesterase, partial [Microthrixaceae bacterium]